MVTAYHVSSETGLTVIEPSVCDSDFRDGDLYGAIVACFTTTTYHGGLPTISPYPRGSAVDSDGYRYTMEFDPDEYDKFFMANTEEKGAAQVHFLLLQRDNGRERAIARFLQECKYKKSFQWDLYFPHGHANDSKHQKVFVNVMFWHAKNVTFEGKVKKQGPVLPPYQVPAGGRRWLERLFQRIPDEKSKYLEQKANAVERRKAKQNAAKSKVQEEESSRTLIRAECTIAKQRAAIEKKEKEEKQKQKIARAAKKKLEEEVEKKKKESDLDEEKAEVLEPDEEQKAVSEDADLELSFDKLSIGTQQN